MFKSNHWTDVSCTFENITPPKRGCTLFQASMVRTISLFHQGCVVITKLKHYVTLTSFQSYLYLQWMSVKLWMGRLKRSDMRMDVCLDLVIKLFIARSSSFIFNTRGHLCHSYDINIDIYFVATHYFTIPFSLVSKNEKPISKIIYRDNV